MRSDKRKFPPHGLAGGAPGTPSWNIINPGREDRILPVLMTEVEKLKKGDVYRHIMSGGGGFGDALAREPERVLRDVIEEKVTIGHAADAYGVVVIDGDPPRLDAKATERLRARRRAEATERTVQVAE